MLACVLYATQAARKETQPQKKRRLLSGCLFHRTVAVHTERCLLGSWRVPGRTTMQVDKPSATPERCALVESNLFDLFASLGATDQQLDFPVVYASARQVCACVKLARQCGPPSTTAGRQVWASYR